MSLTDDCAGRKRKVSKRVRFEVLKRDGFRCRYCGTSSMESVLHVDHVVPHAKGGSDEPSNLIAACAACNIGKSDVELDQSTLAPRVNAEDLLEQAAQIREYAEAALEVQRASESVYDDLCDHWRRWVGEDPLMTWYRSLPRVTREVPLLSIMEAIESVARKHSAYCMKPADQARYFHGCIRKMREANQ